VVAGNQVKIVHCFLATYLEVLFRGVVLFLSICYMSYFFSFEFVSYIYFFSASEHMGIWDC
jgi:hypothetical protein